MQNQCICACGCHARPASQWMRTVTISVFAGFPRDIAGVIAQFCSIVRLREWIDESNLDQHSLYANPGAIDAGMFDLDDGDKIDWWFLAQNPHPRAIDLLKQNRHRLDEDIDALMRNEHPWALEYFITNEEVNKDELAMNSSDIACKILIAEYSEDNSIKPYFFYNSNPRIVELLSIHLDGDDNNVCWDELSYNSSQWAIDLMIANPSKMSTCWLSENRHPWAIEYLRMSQEVIEWCKLSRNPAIFEMREPDGLMDVLIGRIT